jgi:hypothetical protein
LATRAALAGPFTRSRLTRSRITAATGKKEKKYQKEKIKGVHIL